MRYKLKAIVLICSVVVATAINSIPFVAIAQKKNRVSPK